MLHVRATAQPKMHLNLTGFNFLLIQQIKWLTDTSIAAASEADDASFWLYINISKNALYTVCPFLTAHVQRLIAPNVFFEISDF